MIVCGYSWQFLPGEVSARSQLVLEKKKHFTNPRLGPWKGNILPVCLYVVGGTNLYQRFSIIIITFFLSLKT